LKDSHIGTVNVEPIPGDPATGAGESRVSPGVGSRWVAYLATSAGRERTRYWTDSENFGTGRLAPDSSGKIRVATK